MTTDKQVTFEAWVTCSAFPDYEVSSYGFVRRRTPSINAHPGRIVTARIGNSGYVTVALGRDGRRVTCLVHRLVAAEFITNYSSDRRFVNHIDGDKLNNHWSNLEWCTHLENEAHAKRNGLKACGERNRHAKLNADQARQIRIRCDSGEPYSVLAKEFGVTPVQIGRIARRAQWNSRLEAIKP